MKVTTIPAGYRITVVSWENDGDNYSTKVVEGLPEKDARFIAEFASLFKSQNGRVPGIGNLYEPSESEMEEACEEIKKVVAKHAPLSEGLREYFEEDHGYMEYAYDLGLSCGEFWTRVAESVKVEFVPESITMQDVTEQFI